MILLRSCSRSRLPLTGLSRSQPRGEYVMLGQREWLRLRRPFSPLLLLPSPLQEAQESERCFSMCMQFSKCLGHQKGLGQQAEGWHLAGKVIALLLLLLLLPLLLLPPAITYPIRVRRRHGRQRLARQRRRQHRCLQLL